MTIDATAELVLHQLPTTCFSSNLQSLFVNVVTFEDCLCLLDGRLPHLSSFTVNIKSIGTSSSIVDNRVNKFNRIEDNKNVNCFL